MTPVMENRPAVEYVYDHGDTWSERDWWAVEAAALTHFPKVRLAVRP